MTAILDRSGHDFVKETTNLEDGDLVSFENDLDDDLDDDDVVINNAKFNITKPLFMGQHVRIL